MADRVTPPPRSSDDSGERRPADLRNTGVYSERPQASRSTGGYSERPQTSRSSGYGERSQASRGSGYGERRPTASRSPGGSGGRQAVPRRADVIRCENCGEDYSITYKRCPFCDERPGRGGISGKRVANTRGGGYGRPVNPIQIAGLVISLVLIASALFIVIRFVAPIFGGGGKPSSSGQDDSRSSVVSSSSDTSGTGTPVTPPAVESISLSDTDFSLDSAGTRQLTASLLPAGAVGEVTWTSSDVTVAIVDSVGLVTNVNTGSSDIPVTITATCGGVSAQISVTCKAKTAGSTGNSGTVASGSNGRIINAEKGLNIRSGPGTGYDVVASAQNGASITILGEENGFYKINYSGDKIGYVSKDYVSVG